MKKHFLPIVFLALIAFILAPKVLNIIQGPAPTPNIFADGYSIEQATYQSQTSGKPMLILVTADWCPPCQALKKGALSDEKVTNWVKNNMVPVYLEESANPDQIRMLPVNAYPTTLIINEGKVLGHFTGNKSPSSFLSRIKDLASKS
jgi:thioredoxin-related protein